MFEFFTKSELIPHNQSGLKPGDWCISYLLYITHDIYKSLDDGGLETRAVFLDIWKAFDKVWHEGFLFKLKQNGISCNLLNVITDFLYQTEQRVVLNGHSSWTNVEAGVPQGFIHGPLFFLIYINDLSDGLTSDPKLFVDDTILFFVAQNINSTANDLNSDLMKISDWAFQWKIKFDPDPKKQPQKVIFSRKINKIDHPVMF